MLEQVGEDLRSAVAAEVAADRAQQPRSEHVAVREPQLTGPRQVERAPHPVVGGRELRVEPLALGLHDLERGGVDLVGRDAHRCQPAGDVDAVEALGVRREVGQRGEAAERLAEQAPPLDAEVLAQQLEVAHDRVRPEVGEVRRLLGHRPTGDLLGAADRCRQPGAALVEQQQPEVLQRPLHPRRGPGQVGTGALAARPALQEHQERPVLTARLGHLAGVDGQRRTVRAGVVERDLQERGRRRAWLHALRWPRRPRPGFRRVTGR